MQLALRRLKMMMLLILHKIKIGKAEELTQMSRGNNSNTGVGVNPVEDLGNGLEFGVIKG